MLRVTTLIENTPDAAGRLQAEHGLSFWIEDGETRILFDTGQTGRFVDNAKILGVDLERANYLVISHAHYDHAGGIMPFLGAYQARPRLIMSECFFSQGKKYHESDGSVRADFARAPGRRYVGVAFTEEMLMRRGLSPRYNGAEMARLSEHVYLFGNFPRRNAFERLNPAMQLEADGDFTVDPFADEIALALETPRGMVLLLGCAHPGFLNMADAVAERTGAKIYGIVGGTHLVEADAARIEQSAVRIRDMGVQILGLSHCTGEAAIERFRALFPTSFVNCAGAVLDL